MENTIKNLLKISLFLLVGFHASAQAWKPAMEGLYPNQPYDMLSGFSVKFKHNLGGKDWMYGSFYDQDSVKRVIAYRENGRWNSLPFSFYKGSFVKDIEMYGDTLLIGGVFIQTKLDNDTLTFPSSTLLNWYNDSLWLGHAQIYSVDDMSIHGDSLLIWGEFFDTIQQKWYTQFLTTDGGVTWQYPLSIVHPTDTAPDWGAHARLEIVNGEIIMLNSGSPPGNPFRGLVRWDGLQWHSYGQGLFGGLARGFDFDFYNGELYMGGSFWQALYPQNPGNFIARWDGQQWHNLANGLDRQVIDLFPHDSLLYCHSDGVMFGDAYIPHLAAWDGSRWCGTPTGILAKNQQVMVLPTIPYSLLFIRQLRLTEILCRTSFILMATMQKEIVLFAAVGV